MSEIIYRNLKLKIKKSDFHKSDFRGLERIRTAVAAFAELSLATRPQDHGIANVILFLKNANSYLIFLNLQK